MSLKSSYDDMSWVDALKAKKDPKQMDKLAQAKEEDVVDTALVDTANIMFGTPTGEETSQEAINRHAKKIQDDVFTKEKDAVEQASKDRQSQKKHVEVEASKEQQKKAWQEQVLNAVRPQMSFDPETAKGGQISSAASRCEETSGQRTPVPENANSILDPNRLDKLAQQPTAHDKSVAESRKRTADRAEEHKKASQDDSSPISTNEGSRLMRSGGMDSEAFIQRVPANQVSMFDVEYDPTLDAKQRSEQLKDVFLKKLDDNQEAIRQSQQERKEEIQGKKEEDRSWEKVSPPTKTSDMANRLIELWSPKEK